MAGFPLMLLPEEYAAGPAVAVFHEFQLTIKITYLFPYLPVSIMSFKKYEKQPSSSL